MHASDFRLIDAMKRRGPKATDLLTRACPFFVLCQGTGILSLNSKPPATMHKVQYGPLYMSVDKKASVRLNMPQIGNIPQEGLLIDQHIMYCTFVVIAGGLCS